MSEKLLNAQKWYKEKFISNYRFLVPTVFVLNQTKDNKVCLQDNGGFIPTKEEWENYKLLLDDFYKNIPDKEIEIHNSQLMKKHGLMD